jgi:hypothetical protein
LSDGSAVDNERMLRRVNDLVAVLSSLPVSNVYLSESLVIATAYLVYKSEDLRSRSRMSIADFAKDCSVDLTANSVSGITKSSQVVVRCLKQLIQQLPFVRRDTKIMKSNDVLGYLEDVEKHKEMLVQGVQLAGPSQLVKQEVSNIVSKPDCDDTLDEDEIDSYIRTKREVELLKPLYEKLHQ